MAKQPPTADEGGKAEEAEDGGPVAGHQLESDRNKPAGTVKEFGPPKFDERRHSAETARKIAIFLLWITSLTVIGHYVIVVIAQWNGQSDVVAQASDVFKVWLPMLSGFVGTTLAFYFSKRP